VKTTHTIEQAVTLFKNKASNIFTSTHKPKT